MKDKCLVLATIANGGFYNSLTSNDYFDVAHIAFDAIPEDFNPSLSKMFFHKKGFKHHILYDIFTKDWSEVLDEYEYIWLPDYDIEFTDIESIHHLFQEAKKHNTNICQPSLSHDSYYSFGLVLNKKGHTFRRTNYVEVMCPLFRTDVLKNLLWTLKLTYSGWAQDAVWAKELNYEGLGIMDSVIVKHRKPIESQYWILPNGINADKELHLTLELMGIKPEQWWPKEI